MPITTIDGHTIHVDDEGFMTEYSEWSEPHGKTLAAQIGIDLTDEHWQAIRFLRADFTEQGETPTLRRVSTRGGIATTLRSVATERGLAVVFGTHDMGEAGALVLGAIRPGGTHVVYGGLSGKPLPVDAVTLIYRDVTVRGLPQTANSSFQLPRTNVFWKFGLFTAP